MKDDIANGKMGNIQKQFVDENRKLKRSEMELQEKYDKLQKQFEELKTKGSKPKIQTKASQIQILQNELHQKQLQLEKIQHNFHNKIDKYKKIMKNEEEDVLVTSWEDWFSKINKKLVLYKKENLSSTEINQVKVVSFIIQELVTLSPEYLMFILDRARTVPEELMEKIHILEQKLDSCTLERNNLENQLGHVSEDKTNWTQKFEAQDQECNKLREEISNLNVKIQESAEIKQEHEKDKDKFKVKIPKFKLDDKEKKKWKENQKQQQIIQDHLIEELKTTTGILNDTLQLKATLQAENSSLQNTISILEKKLPLTKKTLISMKKISFVV